MEGIEMEGSTGIGGNPESGGCDVGSEAGAFGKACKAAAAVGVVAVGGAALAAGLCLTMAMLGIAAGADILGKAMKAAAERKAKA